MSDFSYTTKTHHIQFQSLPTILIKADKERISQVLINLISNAIKYSPENDKIILRLSKEKNTVTISIQDFELGIPKEEQSKIFDRFFRVKRKTTHKISGLGLGLYISYEIIMQHKGTIKVESDIGKGSIFYITLPIK